LPSCTTPATITRTGTLFDWPSPLNGKRKPSQTGRAEASGGGQAHTGVRRRGDGSPGTARVQDTGDAILRGAGSNAGTGIDYTDAIAPPGQTFIEVLPEV
ncbi:hypothetical protein ACFVGY_36440, partial [Streptomyces sp. NPDC127106]